MSFRSLYLFLCIVGVVVPYSQFIPFLAENGFDIELLLDQLIANRIGSFFGLDVVVCAIVLLAFIYSETRRWGQRRLWIPAIATLTVGVSLGLPLLLYLREAASDTTPAPGRARTA